MQNYWQNLQSFPATAGLKGEYYKIYHTQSETVREWGYSTINVYSALPMPPV